MTIATPGPLDRPDWYKAADYTIDVFELNVVDGLTTTELGSWFVGASPGVGMFIEIVGGQWELYAVFDNAPHNPSGGSDGSIYKGDTTATVIDSLTVVRPWVTFGVISVDRVTPLSVTGWVRTSQKSTPGAPYNPLDGVVIDAEGTVCPAHSVTTIPATFLAPGNHQWCFDCTPALTGVANLSGIIGGSLAGRLVRLLAPVNDVGYYGGVVVSNILPVWQVVNTGGVDVTANMTLTGSV